MGIGIMAKNVIVVGDKELKKYMNTLGTRGDTELKREIKRTATGIENHYRRSAKRHSWTGELERSITADTSNNWLNAEVGSTKKQAYWLEFGRRSFSAKGDGYLTFKTKDGQWHRVKSVREAKANPYLLSAWLEWMIADKFADRLRKRFDNIK